MKEMSIDEVKESVKNFIFDAFGIEDVPLPENIMYKIEWVGPLAERVKEIYNNSPKILEDEELKKANDTLDDVGYWFHILNGILKEYSKKQQYLKDEDVEAERDKRNQHLLQAGRDLKEFIYTKDDRYILQAYAHLNIAYPDDKTSAENELNELGFGDMFESVGNLNRYLGDDIHNEYDIYNYFVNIQAWNSNIKKILEKAKWLKHDEAWEREDMREVDALNRKDVRKYVAEKFAEYVEKWEKIWESTGRPRIISSSEEIENAFYTWIVKSQEYGKLMDADVNGIKLEDLLNKMAYFIPIGGKFVKELNLCLGNNPDDLAHEIFHFIGFHAKNKYLKPLAEDEYANTLLTEAYKKYMNFPEEEPEGTLYVTKYRKELPYDKAERMARGKDWTEIIRIYKDYVNSKDL